MRRFCPSSHNVLAAASCWSAATMRNIVSAADFDQYDGPSRGVAASSSFSSNNDNSSITIVQRDSTNNSNEEPSADDELRIQMSVWTPQQHAFRNILKALRGAYYNDRAKLFWTRHFVRVEFYKYEKFVGEGDVRFRAQQEKMMKEMLAKEEQAAKQDTDLGDLLGMGATTDEELAAAARELINENDNNEKKEESEENPMNAIPISSSKAVGLTNSPYASVRYFYTREKSSPSPQHQHLVNIANECADFVDKYMKISVERIVHHNDVMMSLSVPDAKRFREAYLLREEQHDSWCKQKIRQILDRRPVAPYPYC